MKALAKTYISANLRGIDALYRAGTSPRKSLFYSKLAILELCGWIEVSMDGVVDSCAKRNLNEGASIALVANRIKRTYGFDYDQHFRELIIRILGLRSLETIEGDR